jgi:hypothetical protein
VIKLPFQLIFLIPLSKILMTGIRTVMTKVPTMEMERMALPITMEMVTGMVINLELELVLVLAALAMERGQPELELVVLVDK